MDEEQKKEIRKAKRFTETIDERLNNSIVPDYGLCSSCSNMSYREYDKGQHAIATCESYHINSKPRLSSVNRINKCSGFERKGVPSLEMMWSIAKRIDIEEKKIIGFTNEKVFSVKEPDDALSQSDLYEITEFND